MYDIYEWKLSVSCEYFIHRYETILYANTHSLSIILSMILKAGTRSHLIVFFAPPSGVDRSIHGALRN